MLCVFSFLFYFYFFQTLLLNSCCLFFFAVHTITRFSFNSKHGGQSLSFLAETRDAEWLTFWFVLKSNQPLSCWVWRHVSKLSTSRKWTKTPRCSACCGPHIQLIESQYMKRNSFKRQICVCNNVRYVTFHFVFRVVFISSEAEVIITMSRFLAALIWTKFHSVYSSQMEAPNLTLWGKCSLFCPFIHVTTFAADTWSWAWQSSRHVSYVRPSRCKIDIQTPAGFGRRCVRSGVTASLTCAEWSHVSLISQMCVSVFLLFFFFFFEATLLHA